jgi:6-pyruvoyltetrahydropterin/6-carboxytetrahydropterin synthase|tara:strand:- start:256 stop:681 length:426 start_codon:yes stop_codon:yes gene_type:complete
MNSKNTTFLTKVFTFCAAHQYGNEKWTDEENWDVFGKDTRVHGHNYTLHVTVTGKVNPDSGFLVDLGHLKKIVNTYVVDVLDHSQFDKDIPWFKGKQPSTEVLVTFIWEEISKRLEGCTLHRIRIEETPTIYTDYYGPVDE